MDPTTSKAFHPCKRCETKSSDCIFSAPLARKRKSDDTSQSSKKSKTKGKGWNEGSQAQAEASSMVSGFTDLASFAGHQDQIEGNGNGNGNGLDGYGDNGNGYLGEENSTTSNEQQPSFFPQFNENDSQVIDSNNDFTSQEHKFYPYGNQNFQNNYQDPNSSSLLPPPPLPPSSNLNPQSEGSSSLLSQASPNFSSASGSGSGSTMPSESKHVDEKAIDDWLSSLGVDLNSFPSTSLDQNENQNHHNHDEGDSHQTSHLQEPQLSSSGSKANRYLKDDCFLGSDSFSMLQPLNQITEPHPSGSNLPLEEPHQEKGKNSESHDDGSEESKLFKMMNKIQSDIDVIYQVNYSSSNNTATISLTTASDLETTEIQSILQSISEANSLIESILPPTIDEEAQENHREPFKPSIPLLLLSLSLKMIKLLGLVKDQVIDYLKEESDNDKTEENEKWKGFSKSISFQIDSLISTLNNCIMVSELRHRKSKTPCIVKEWSLKMKEKAKEVKKELEVLD